MAISPSYHKKPRWGPSPFARYQNFDTWNWQERAAEIELPPGCSRGWTKGERLAHRGTIGSFGFNHVLISHPLEMSDVNRFSLFDGLKAAVQFPKP